MHGGRQIDRGAGLQLPAPSQRNGDDAAAAATKWAVARPAMPANCPQTALPTVVAPKTTVRNIASPRPRTQSGKRDLGRDVENGQDQRPRGAGDEAGADRDEGFMRKPEQHERDAGGERRPGDEAIGPELGLQPVEREGAADRADAERAEQDAVMFRPPGHLAARQQRQQRPIGGGEGKERQAPGPKSRANIRLLAA